MEICILTSSECKRQSNRSQNDGKMKSFGVCFLLICYQTTIIVTESVQEAKYFQKDGDVVARDLALYCSGAPFYTDDGVLVQTKTQFDDLPQSAKATPRSIVHLGSKRANQFKNLMLGRDTSKDASDRVQKGSYIPVKSNGKRDYSPPTAYGIYMGPNDIDLFQKWLSSYYLQ